MRIVIHFQGRSYEQDIKDRVQYREGDGEVSGAVEEVAIRVERIAESLAFVVGKLIDSGHLDALDFAKGTNSSWAIPEKAELIIEQ